MTRRTDMARIIAMALVAVALLGILTPVCTMPECTDTAAGTCSDFQPVCDDCPDSVVMKHTHDDAIRVQAQTFESPTVLAHIESLPDVAVISQFFAAPDATASPPPVDPLGVRLSV